MLQPNVMLNEYRHNNKFAQYVDEYCARRGIPVKEALEHESVRQACLQYTEV